MPDVVLASDAPPVDVSASGNPSRSASATAWSTRRPDRSSFSIGHQRAISVNSAVVSGTASAVSSDRISASTASRSCAPDRPDVDLQLAPLGDDVRPRPARDHADVDRDAVPSAVQRVESLDEVGGGEDRVPALLGLDAGVGGPAVDRDPGVDDALARRHDVAVRPGGLEDEARVGIGGLLDDVRRRRERADLLVGVRDERQPLERERPAGRAAP